ncbi:hypothetical protein GGX14DRAFT_559289 [Mycena pura]|uniref:Uncharacterized protein n=1 Tax=Mycena pura TaxID=153505 RepID=A0AAD6YJY6_9AGAR|nr:hypothetical protein GGX14DRAFT_559289 [Mycena pura]
MSIFSFSSSSRPYYAFPEDSKPALDGHPSHHQGEAAHCIPASVKADDVVDLAGQYNIVSEKGPDNHAALGVSNPLRNGMWLCANCHKSLGRDISIVLCPPLTILRVILDEWDRLQTLQDFCKMKYKHFPRLRSVYHLLQVGRLAPPPLYSSTGRVVNIGREQFCLHDTPDPDGALRQYRFDSEPTVPHLWRFPCLKPENVMAVLLHLTGDLSKDSLLSDPPPSALTYDDQMRTLLFRIKGRILQTRAAKYINSTALIPGEDRHGDLSETGGTEMGGGSRFEMEEDTEEDTDTDGAGDGE